MTRALIAALLGAAVITPDRPGLGWLLAGLGLVLIAGRLDGLNAVAVALLGVGVIRSAGWLFAICALAALMLLAASVVGVKTWRELATALPRWVHAGVRAFPRPGHGAGRGLVIAVAALVLFGFLLSFADQAFGELLEGWLSAGPQRLLTFVVLLVLALGMRGSYEPSQPTERPAWRKPDWMIPVAALNLLFGVFAAVQFRTLFGGHEYVLDPHGPTYAQHARGGFAALGVVAVLALAVVAVALSRLADGDRRLARFPGRSCGSGWRCSLGSRRSIPTDMWRRQSSGVGSRTAISTRRTSPPFRGTHCRHWNGYLGINETV